MTYDNDANLLLIRAGELAGVAFFLGMLFLGVTNRVVICRDGHDLLWTLAPPVVVFASLLLGVFFARDMHDPEGIIRGFLYAGVVGAVAAAYRPLRWSVEDNGFCLGWIVFVFKLIVCPLLVLLSVVQACEAAPRDAWVDREDNYHPARGVSASHLAASAGCAALLERLINGREAYLRRWERQMLSPGKSKPGAKPRPQSRPVFRVPKIELANPNRSAGTRWQ